MDANVIPGVSVFQYLALRADEDIAVGVKGESLGWNRFAQNAHFGQGNSASGNLQGRRAKRLFSYLDADHYYCRQLQQAELVTRFSCRAGSGGLCVREYRESELISREIPWPTLLCRAC
jgi:hypothetical protein